MARDFEPWDLDSFDDYVREDGKQEARIRPPSAMNIIYRPVEQKI